MLGFFGVGIDMACKLRRPVVVVLLIKLFRGVQLEHINVAEKDIVVHVEEDV